MECNCVDGLGSGPMGYLVVMLILAALALSSLLGELTQIS